MLFGGVWWGMLRGVEWMLGRGGRGCIKKIKERYVTLYAYHMGEKVG